MMKMDVKCSSWWAEKRFLKQKNEVNVKKIKYAMKWWWIIIKTQLFLQHHFSVLSKEIWDFAMCETFTLKNFSVFTQWKLKLKIQKFFDFWIILHTHVFCQSSELERVKSLFRRLMDSRQIKC
jgi:hypothetical protein